VFSAKSKFTPGQSVRILPLKVDGVVYIVQFGPGGVVTYDCFWWFNGERKASILTEAELAEA